MEVTVAVLVQMLQEADIQFPQQHDLESKLGEIAAVTQITLHAKNWELLTACVGNANKESSTFLKIYRGSEPRGADDEGN